VGCVPEHSSHAAYASTGLAFCPSVTSALRIRHSKSKLYCTLVLGRGEAGGGICPASEKARVSTWLPVAAATLSLSATTERAPARSPIQASAKPNWETGGSPAAGAGEEPSDGNSTKTAKIRLCGADDGGHS
jgi:hypothetical protein